MTLSKDDAATLLGCPAGEILEVTDAPAGTLITMADGSSYIDVDEDTPDADGKTGLMYRELPHATYLGTFPVYAPTAQDPIPAESAAESDPESGPDEDPADEDPAVDEAGDPPADAAAVPVRGKPAKAAG